MAKQYQVCDLQPGKGMSIAQSNEHLRIGQENAYKKTESGTMDPTREHLNFEVTKGGKIVPVNKKKSITRRIKEIFKEKGIRDPNEGLKEGERTRRTVANFILQGSRDRMRELAFGNQEVNYERGADNSTVERQAAIEQWAIDSYNFMCKKYGEENIAAFIVHLDETNPHIHCTVLPITEKNKISWKKFFKCDTKESGSKAMNDLHNELYNEVSKKYGLSRGESILKTGAQHKSYKQWLEETIKQQSGIMIDNDIAIQEQREILQELTDGVKKAERRQKGLTTMLENLQFQKDGIEFELDEINRSINDGEAKNDELEAKLRQLRTDLQLTEDKIEERKEQLRIANEQLQAISERQAEFQQKYNEMIKAINEKMPTYQAKVYHDMESSAWKVIAKEIMERAQPIQDFLESLPEEKEEEFRDIFDGSFVEMVTEKAGDVVAVASALFLGYIDQATNYAESCGGGGGGPQSGWGKRENENEESFRHRCLFASVNMLQPKGYDDEERESLNNNKKRHKKGRGI